jgi:hypothetical protein
MMSLMGAGPSQMHIEDSWSLQRCARPAAEWGIARGEEWWVAAFVEGPCGCGLSGSFRELPNLNCIETACLQQGESNGQLTGRGASQGTARHELPQRMARDQQCERWRGVGADTFRRRMTNQLTYGLPSAFPLERPYGKSLAQVLMPTPRPSLECQRDPVAESGTLGVLIARLLQVDSQGKGPRPIGCWPWSGICGRGISEFPTASPSDRTNVLSSREGDRDPSP